ncbi:MAG: hypothetical protein ABI838_07655 [Chloroflexota bacterium]
MRRRFHLSHGEVALAGGLVLGLALALATGAWDLHTLSTKDPEVMAYQRAGICPGAGTVATDCYEQYRALIANIGTMSGPGSDCAAVLASDVGEEVASFDCADTDVVVNGETVTIKKWRGEIVEMLEPGGITRYGVGMGGSPRTVLASASLFFGGLLALAYLAALLFVAGTGLIQHRGTRPALVSEDGAWWWDGRQWQEIESAGQLGRSSSFLPIMVALLVGASLLGATLALAGEVAGSRATGPPSTPCPPEAPSSPTCFQLVAGQVATVAERAPCSVGLDSSAGRRSLSVPCSDTYLFTVGRYQSARFWEGDLFWVSQGSDPTWVGVGVPPGALSLAVIPSGLALIGAMVSFVVHRFRRRVALAVDTSE